MFVCFRSTFVWSPAYFGANFAFLGTLFFYQFRGLLGIDFMNRLNYTAANVGIREFDAAVDGLATAINAASFPFLSANLNLTREPQLSSLISPYRILDFNGTKVALVAWISNLLPTEGNPGPTVSLSNQIAAVRRAVDYATADGATIIIGLSSQDLVATDLDLASQVSGLDAIVGGYASGDVLYINNNPNPTAFPSKGRYPGVATGPTGRDVPIGAIGRFGRFVGRLELEFDNRGILLNYSGNAIPLNSTVVPTPDAAVQNLLETKYNETVVFGRLVVGRTGLPLIGDRTVCRFGECNLGNVICDAMRNQSGANICIFNAGGIRATIPAGNVTFGQVVDAFPFGNTMSTFSLRGSDLAAIFNYGVSRAENASNAGTGRFLQIGGVRLSWNPALPATGRITKLQIENPSTGAFEDLQPQKAYTVTTSNFVASGGDGYIDVGLPGNVIPGTLALFGRPLDAVLISYLQSRDWVNTTLDGRITISNSTTVVDLIPPRNLFRASDGMRWALLGVTIALTLVPIIISFVFIKHRLHAVVVASSEVFVHIILYGAVLTYAGLIAFQVGFDNAGCMIFPWLSSVGFAVMYGALFAKTYRIWTVFRGLKTLKRANVTNQQLGIIVAIFVGIEIILLIVWTAVSPLQYRTIPDGTPTIPNDYENCYSENSHIFFAIGLAIKGAYLILGIVMAFVTRKVQSDFSESKYISFSVYGTFVSLVVILVVLFITGLNPTIRFILTTIGGWVVINTIVLTLSVPKLISIVADPTNLWETYFAKRARSMNSQSMNRGLSTTVSSISSLSESDIRDTIKDMNDKQKEAELTKLVAVWKDTMEAQKKVWQDIAFLRTHLKKENPAWTAEMAKFEPKEKKEKKSKKNGSAKKDKNAAVPEAKKVAKKGTAEDSSDSDTDSESEHPPAKTTASPKAKKAGKKTAKKGGAKKSAAAKKEPESNVPPPPTNTASPRPGIDYVIESSSEEEPQPTRLPPKSGKKAAAKESSSSSSDSSEKEDKKPASKKKESSASSDSSDSGSD